MPVDNNYPLYRPSDEEQVLENGPPFLELFPGAAALWGHHRSVCVFNACAKDLIYYSEADFRDRPILWVERIHPEDRNRFSRSMDDLGKDMSVMQCDYRFYPKGKNRPIWLRERARKLREGAAMETISTYTEISDLRTARAAGSKNDDLSDMARVLIHEFENRVQKITMELELAQMDPRRKLNSSSVLDSVKQSLEDLRNQVIRILERWTCEDLLPIVDDIVRKMRKELNRQNVKMRLVRREQLPLVEGDKDQLRSALEQVFEFCGSMVKQGGHVEVEARPREVSGEVYAEVCITSSSSASNHGYGGEENVQPSEGHRIGMGIMLATEILRRYRGEVSFRKEGTLRGQVTVRIRGLS